MFRYLALALVQITLAVLVLLVNAHVPLWMVGLAVALNVVAAVGNLMLAFGKWSGATWAE